MKLPQWAESPECVGRTLCTYCRDTGERGTGFRARLARDGWPLPSDAPDFACPHGVPWDYHPDPATLAVEEAERELLAAANNPEGWGDHVAAMIHRVGADRAWKTVRRLAGAAESCGGCNERRKVLNRLEGWVKGVFSERPLNEREQEHRPE